LTGLNHHPLDVAQESRTLVTITAISDRLAAALKKPFRLDLTDVEIPSDFLDQIHITRDAVNEIREKLPSHMEAVHQMLS
jgi:hypothetical protein